MKKKVFFLPLVAALALTGCSNDEPAPNGNQSPDGESQYLAISIVSTDNGASRYTEGTLEYEDGTEAENAVNGLRVYFFNSYGYPVNVKNNSGNYYDVPLDQITTSGPEHGLTVEKKINAVLIVGNGEATPTQLVAVLNPDTSLGTGSYTLTDLRRQIGNYSKLANENSQFVMANSVYVDGGNVIEAQTILPQNYANSKEEALASPVTVYVERNVAKVRVNASMTGKTALADGGIMCPVYDNATKQPYTITTNGTETAVYVKFLGWDVTADLEYAYLSKNVRTGWRENILGSGKWNDPDHHRSYWADVCDGGTSAATNNNQYFSYASGTNFTLNKFDGRESKYCNENGEKKGTSGMIYANTEIIIKGELCDGDGNPLTFTELAGVRTIDDANYTYLKNRFLLMLRSGRAHSHWKVYRDAEGNITKAEEITADDITFMTANEAANRGINSATRVETVENGTYYVYARLTPEVEADDSFEWYTNITREDIIDSETGAVTGQTITVKPGDKKTTAEINAHLLDLSHAKIWNSGKTYYFATIMQGATLPGVVRNHIYDMNLKNVYGIGTPVYNPDEVIVPEKPQDDDTFVAAEIKILSWRLISNDVNLEWD